MFLKLQFLIGARGRSFLAWTKGGKEFFSLRVKGDSMYPKFIEGDAIILRKEDDRENGDICAVYVNGRHDLTYFNSADDAANAGYTPCSVCR